MDHLFGTSSVAGVVIAMIALAGAMGCEPEPSTVPVTSPAVTAPSTASARPTSSIPAPTPAEIMSANPPPGKAPASASADAAAAPPPARVPNAERVIASLNSKFSACYSQALTMNPTIAVRGVMTVAVAPSGDVESAAFTMNEALDPTMTACLTRAVSAAKFDPPVPDGGHAKLLLPIVFTPDVR